VHFGRLDLGDCVGRGVLEVEHERLSGGQDARDFYVRQLGCEGLGEDRRARDRRLSALAQMCCSTLARAHARTGDRFAIGGYLGKAATFDRALVEFADRYADQNERDFEALREAAASGRVTAELGS
jgi:hypothetical protein